MREVDQEWLVAGGPFPIQNGISGTAYTISRATVPDGEQQRHLMQASGLRDRGFLQSRVARGIGRRLVILRRKGVGKDLHLHLGVLEHFREERLPCSTD